MSGGTALEPGSAYAGAKQLLAKLERPGTNLDLTLARGFSAVTSALLAVADTAGSVTETATRVKDLGETVSLLVEVLDPAITAPPPRCWPWRWLRRPRAAAAAAPGAPDPAAWLSPSVWQQRAAVRPVDRVARWDDGEDGPRAGDQVLCRDVWHMAESVDPDPGQSGWIRARFDDGTGHLAAPGELTVVRRYLACDSSNDDVLQVRQLLESGHITATGGSYSHLDHGTGAGLGDIAARWWAAASEQHQDADGAGSSAVPQVRLLPGQADLIECPHCGVPMTSCPHGGHTGPGGRPVSPRGPEESQ